MIHINKNLARKLGLVSKGESKYHSIKTEGPDVDGIGRVIYDSKLEAERAAQLVLMQKNGLINKLMRQVACKIVVNRIHICDYVADFVYFTDDGRYVVEDCKSPITRRLASYRIKKKLMYACHKVVIEEIGSGRRSSGRRASRR